jgi:hypothetical protein
LAILVWHEIENDHVMLAFTLASCHDVASNLATSPQASASGHELVIFVEILLHSPIHMVSPSFRNAWATEILEFSVRSPSIVPTGSCRHDTS